MQKIFFVCVINFPFPQSFYIWLLTIGHDYLVPVDKHDSDLGDNCIQNFIWGGISSDIRSEI